MEISNKKFFVLVIFIAFVGFGIFFFLRTQRNNSSSSNTTDSSINLDDTESGVVNDDMSEVESKNVNKMTPTTNSDKYLDYSQSSYQQNSDKKRILFFHAAWCPFCRAADEDFRANLSDIPEDVVIFKTDYDTEDELKEKYGVTYQHTFVQVDKDGNEVTKWNGGELEELLANIK